MKPSIHKSIQISLYGLFPIITFLYFYFLVDTSLIYFKQQPIFFFNVFFFNQHLGMPGGITQYISMFFAQFLFSNLWGSIVIALLLTGVAFLTNKLFKGFSLKFAYTTFLSLVPSLILAFILSDYQAQLNTIISYLFIVCFALLNIYLSKFNLWIKLISIVIINFLAFYLFGGIVLWGTVLLNISYDLFKTSIHNKRFTIPLSIISTVAIAYVISTLSPYINLTKGCKGILFDIPKTSIAALYYILYLYPFIVILKAILFKKFTTRLKNENIFSSIIQISAFAALWVIIFIFAPQKEARHTIELHDYASQSRWNEVVSTAKKLPLNSRDVFFEINRALYHQGQLLENGFMVPQIYGEHGLILTSYYNSKVLMLCSDLYHDMGFSKNSLHWAYEAQTKYQMAPNVLKRIITDNIMLGNYRVAEKFLNIFSASLIHKTWCKSMRHFLYNDEAVKQCKEFNKNAKISTIRDSYSNMQYPQFDLEYILNENPGNNMALEYYMFNALLRHDFKSLTSKIQLFEQQHYKKFPRHIEEALIMLEVLDNNLKFDTGTLQIRQSTYKRFDDFTKMLIKYRKEKSISINTINEKYGNTFWYYITFNSPITNKREFKEKKI